MAKASRRTFSYRAGVRVRGSILACDAATGSDLIFLSHALALEARAARLLPRPRAGKRQVLTTETTLALLVAASPGGKDRLRSFTLTAAYGRPFMLGNMRLELFPSGHLPGAASVLCDLDGHRLVYAGPLGAGTPGAGPPANRTAEALCVDGTFGAPHFAFPPPAETLTDVCDTVRAALAAGRSPVILARPMGPALDIAAALAAGDLRLRAHRHVIRAASAYRAAGLAVPPLLRFAGRLQPGEALLWPPEARDAGILGALEAPFFVLASGWAADPAVVATLRVDRAIPLSNYAGFPRLLDYIEASGAREVAVRHAPDGHLCSALAARGIDAYPLGPPQQIALF
jgi:putative mRNA 3-end processing factor